MIATRSGVSTQLTPTRVPLALGHDGRRIVPLLACMLVVSVVFGLPHILIPRILGGERIYTPLAVSSVSALTYDETSSYAAYVNYVVRRVAPPYDTDIFENRDIPVHASVAPYFAVAGLAALVGGVERAFIVADFLLPPLALLVLFALLRNLTQNRSIALIGALTILLVPFGPRNFLEVPFKLLANGGKDVIQPLEYSRLMHPEFSFTLFVTGLLLLWLALRNGHIASAVLAGVVGALLFYTYMFYWPVWVGACALLAVVWPLVDRQAGPALYVTNLVTWLGSIPFWLTLLDATRYSNLTTVVARHVSETGHIPPVQKLVYTLVCCVIFATFAAIFWRFSSYLGDDGTRRKRVLVFLSAIFLAAIAALNMEVITGVNLEAMLHYTNRLLQPFLALAAFVLVLPSMRRSLRRLHVPLTDTYGRAMLAAAVVVLIANGGLRQVLVSANVAGAHEYTEQHKLLFSWLDAHTRLDDVVLATAKDVNDLIPVFTPDRVFVPNGERTSASNEEIARRFLIAMKVLGHNESDVRRLLAQDVYHGEPPIGLTYTYFLFLGIGAWRLADSEIERLLSEYRILDLSRELGRWRVDYVYGRGAERPADVPGWTFGQSYADAYGTLWRIRPVQKPGV